jgi:TetR/AcrR family transcriptional regulator, mexJK operon transcriptional repressor
LTSLQPDSAVIRLGPGRPLDLAKRQAVLAAAKALLVAKGPSVGMDAIAAAAGVAKQTIYNSWPNKQALFTAVISESADALTAGLVDVDPAAPIDGVLIALARSYLDLVWQPTSIAFLCAMMGDESWRSGFGTSFWEAGPQLSYTRLAAYLTDQAERGVLSLPDVGLATEHFYSLARGNRHLQVLLGHMPPPSDAERDVRAQAAVKVFLAAYAVAAAAD